MHNENEDKSDSPTLKPPLSGLTEMENEVSSAELTETYKVAPANQPNFQGITTIPTTFISPKIKWNSFWIHGFAALLIFGLFYVVLSTTLFTSTTYFMTGYYSQSGHEAIGLVIYLYYFGGREASLATIEFFALAVFIIIVLLVLGLFRRNSTRKPLILAYVCIVIWYCIPLIFLAENWSEITLVTSSLLVLVGLGVAIIGGLMASLKILDLKTKKSLLQKYSLELAQFAKNQDPINGEATLLKSLMIDPPNMELWVILANIYAQFGDISKCIEVFQRILVYCPEKAEVWDKYLQIASKSKEYRRFQESLTNLAITIPDSIFPLYYAGQLATIVKDYSEAEIYLDQVQSKKTEKIQEWNKISVELQNANPTLPISNLKPTAMHAQKMSALLKERVAKIRSAYLKLSAVYGLLMVIVPLFMMRFSFIFVYAVISPLIFSGILFWLPKHFQKTHPVFPLITHLKKRTNTIIGILIIQFLCLFYAISGLYFMYLLVYPPVFVLLMVASSRIKP